MRLGILQAGDINPKMKGNLPNYRDMYDALFDKVVPKIALTYFDITKGDFPSSVDDCDAYLITGSPSGVYDEEDWIARLKDFIPLAYTAGKKLIGICFGHQIIAEALGGKAEKSDQGWGVGVRSIKIEPPPHTPHKQDADLNLLYMHQDQVVKAPTGANVLGGDEFCPIAAYHIGDQVFCVQGHPEFTPEVVDAIMDFRISAIGKDRVAEGKYSLKNPHHGDEVGAWFGHFLNRQE